MRLILFLFFLLIPQLSHAGTGIDLLSRCQKVALLEKTGESRHVSGAVYCLGYVYSLGRFFSEKELSAFKVCLPPNWTNGQLAKVIVKFLEDNPQKLHDDDFFLSILALHTAFPCAPE